MTMSLPDLLPSLVADANLAPSVHNIQPSRWRLDGDALYLFGDLGRSIPIADPTMRDWRLSHGAQFEGMKIALASAGCAITDVEIEPSKTDGDAEDLVRIASLRAVASGVADDQAKIDLELARRRQTWRGNFQALDQMSTDKLSQLSSARADCSFISGDGSLRDIARLYDKASMRFLRDADHRHELLYWLRLGESHAEYERDGLSAAAMGLGSVEAWAAGLVLGPLFRGLDKVGLAQSLLSEAAKTKTAAAIVLMPRPADEDPFETGQHFYRLWLDFERYGFAACPMSLLVDWDAARSQLEKVSGVPSGQKICAAFRIGVPRAKVSYPRARLPVDELLV